MKTFKQKLENNPGLSLIGAALLGLAFPYGSLIPEPVIIIFLALMMFLSYFRMHVPVREVLSKKLILFYAARFIVLPLVLWMFFRKVLPEYALGVLLLALCPAGASSAALTGVYNGNVTLTLVVTIVSNLASVVVIPAMIGILNHTQVHLSTWGLLQTLFCSVVLPGIVYSGMRHVAPVRRYCHQQGRFWTLFIISFLTFVVVAKKRGFFLDQPGEIVIPFLSGLAVYATALLGFLVKGPVPDRIAYGVCSAFNNTMLGIGLALLYFDDKTIAIMIATEISWVMLPLFVQPVIRRLQPDAVKA